MSVNYGQGYRGTSMSLGMFSQSESLSPFYWDSKTFNFDERVTGANRGQPGEDAAARNGGKPEAEVFEGHWDDDELTSNNKRKRNGRHPSSSESKMKKFKVDVIRNLLANFNLEDTIDKYRSLASTSIKVDPAEFSYDCSLAASRLKEKVQTLTGSNQVQINNRNFTRYIEKNQHDQYQANLQKADESRANAECDRLRRLLQSGIINTDELQTDECIVSDLQRRSQNKKTVTMATGNVSPAKSPKKVSYMSLEQAGKSRSNASSKAQFRLPQNKSNLSLPSICNIPNQITKNVHIPVPIKQQLSEKESSRDFGNNIFKSKPRSNNPELEKLEQQTTIKGLYKAADEMIRQTTTSYRRHPDVIRGE